MKPQENELGFTFFIYLRVMKRKEFIGTLAAGMVGLILPIPGGISVSDGGGNTLTPTNFLPKPNWIAVHSTNPKGTGYIDGKTTFSIILDVKDDTMTLIPMENKGRILMKKGEVFIAFPGGMSYPPEGMTQEEFSHEERESKRTVYIPLEDVRGNNNDSVRFRFASYKLETT